MKNKIITLLLKWARKIIWKYDKSYPPFIETQYKIQKIRSEHFFTDTEQELLKLYEDKMLEELKKQMVTSVANVMTEIGAVKFDFEQDMRGNKIKIIGTTYVPEKLS